MLRRAPRDFSAYQVGAGSVWCWSGAMGAAPASGEGSSKAAWIEARASCARWQHHLRAAKQLDFLKRYRRAARSIAGGRGRTAFRGTAPCLMQMAFGRMELRCASVKHRAAQQYFSKLRKPQGSAETTMLRSTGRSTLPGHEAKMTLCRSAAQRGVTPTLTPATTHTSGTCCSKPCTGKDAAADSANAECRPTCAA